MKPTKLLKRYFFIAGLVVLLVNCNPEKNLPGWNTNILTPLVTSNLSIEKLVADSLIKKNSDQSLTLVYKYPLYQSAIADLLNVKDTTKIYSAKLGKTKLSNRFLTQNISLGQLASNLGPTGSLIIALHGQTTIIPAIPPTSSGTSVDVDANSFFKSAQLDSGWLDITLENQFPIDLTDVVFTINNKSNGTNIVRDTIPFIMAGSQFSKSISLAGKYVEGNLTAAILSIASPGSNGLAVPIDTAKALKITLGVRDLSATSATAVFPTQNLIDLKDSVLYDFGKAQLKYMIIRTGKVVMQMFSTLQDTLRIEYNIPGATLGATSVEIKMNVPPAPIGGVSSVTREYDLNGYRVDLRGNSGQVYNYFYNTFVARIDSSGKLVSLSTTDSVWVRYGLYNIIPEYAEGYLGQDTIEAGPSSSNIDLFNRINGGTLDLEDVKMNLSVENGIGVNGNMEILSVKTANTRNNQQSQLSGSALTAPFSINRASQPPLTPSKNTLLLNKANSNSKQLLEILPNRLDYHIKLFTNPAGNTSNYNDFIYYDSKIAANLELEVPLWMSASKLVLIDTQQFDFTSQANAINIKSGTFKLICTNGFPLQANIQAYFLDENKLLIDSLLPSGMQPIQAGQVDGGTLLVTSKTKSIVQAQISEAKMDKLRRSKWIIIKADFSTVPSGSRVKIFSDYNLEAKLTGDFIYHAGKK